MVFVSSQLKNHAGFQTCHCHNSDVNAKEAKRTVRHLTGTGVWLKLRELSYKYHEREEIISDSVKFRK